MQDREDTPTPADKADGALFVPDWPQYNQPSRIVTLGHYYPKEEAASTSQLLRETRADYTTAASPNARTIDAYTVRQNLGWTQLIYALNQERQWPLKRLFAILDPMLEPGIALVVVPTHMAYQAFWPTRALARQLAEQDRVDATSCLVRHTTIRRITFGGPSTRALHRQTIRIENPHLIAGQRVLLLDDIAKSGASLEACRDLLYEAGAALVQAMALGRVILSGSDSR